MRAAFHGMDSSSDSPHKNDFFTIGLTNSIVLFDEHEGSEKARPKVPWRDRIHPGYFALVRYSLILNKILYLSILNEKHSCTHGFEFQGQEGVSLHLIWMGDMLGAELGLSAVTFSPLLPIWAFFVARLHLEKAELLSLCLMGSIHVM